VRTHRLASHTAQEMRRLSNLGHVVEGTLLAAVGLLALLATLGSAEWPNTVYAGLMVAAGVVLLIALYPRHPVSDWGTIWSDPQQRENTIMAAAVGLAGVAELLARGRSPFGFAWPAALALIGTLFLTHAQHGTGEAMGRAVRRHRWIGGDRHGGWGPAPVFSDSAWGRVGAVVADRGPGGGHPTAPVPRTGGGL